MQTAILPDKHVKPQVTGSSPVGGVGESMQEAKANDKNVLSFSADSNSKKTLIQIIRQVEFVGSTPTSRL